MSSRCACAASPPRNVARVSPDCVTFFASCGRRSLLGSTASPSFAEMPSFQAFAHLCAALPRPSSLARRERRTRLFAIEGRHRPRSHTSGKRSAVVYTGCIQKRRSDGPTTQRRRHTARRRRHGYCMCGGRSGIQVLQRNGQSPGRRSATPGTRERVARHTVPRQDQEPEDHGGDRREPQRRRARQTVGIRPALRGDQSAPAVAGAAHLHARRNPQPGRASRDRRLLSATIPTRRSAHRDVSRRSTFCAD